MKQLLIVAVAAAAMVITSCSKEESIDRGPDAGAYSVSVALNGSARLADAGTRAAGDVTGTLAALDKEKTVSSLLAVAFDANGSTDDGKLYKVFDVAVNTGVNPTFDMAAAGTFDVWFVANADETLAGSIKALTAGTATETDLGVLVGTQACDADNQFLMVSVDSKVIKTSPGADTKVTVTMRRASVRYDIVNAIDGVTVTGVKFVNRATNTRIATANAQSEFTGATFEDKSYTVSIAGYEVPAASPDAQKEAAAKYEAQIYSYENIGDDNSKISSLELTYTVDGTGVSKTHTVNFTDDTGAELALKRNHLYRIVLTEKRSDMNLVSKLTVLDWEAADAFEFEELPFEQPLNAKLLVNRFAQANVSAAGLDMTASSFAFSADATSAYEAFSSEWNGKKFTDKGDVHGTQYRVPTADEWALLLPKKTDATTDCPFVCFAEGKMTATAFTETITVDGTQISGSSTLKYDATGSAVYALRFAGSEQAAAYRYAFADNALSIKVIALGKESQTAIDDVENLAWATDGAFIEIKLPANGYYADSDADKATLLEQNTTGYYWSATEDATNTDNAMAVSFSSTEAAVASLAKGAFYALRPISDFDTPVLK